MRKKKHIDFVLYEDNYEKLIFRFYPRLSSCHSFDENLPTKWEEVYKVYYNYRILKFYKYDRGYDGYDVLYDTRCDECSVIRTVAAWLKLLSEGKKEIIIDDAIIDAHTVQLLDNEIYDFADCTWWTIREGSHDSYKFELFRYDDVGYRFWLPKEQAYEFGKYLDECCEYMLAHGDPI